MDPLTPSEEQKKEGGTPAVEPEPAQETPLVHSYSDDMAKAMQATEAGAVQELLAMAREKEETSLKTEKERKTSWLFILGAFLCFAAAGAALWVLWNSYQRSMPVPVQRERQVIFSQLMLVNAESTDIREVVSNAKSHADLRINTPYTIALIDANGLPLEPDAFMAFAEGNLPADFLSAIDTVRLGIVATGNTASPFILLQGKEGSSLTQKLSNIEPVLVRAFYRALGIDIRDQAEIFDQPFETIYVNNVPVRAVTGTGNTPVAFYGFAEAQTAIITTDKDAFNAVYLGILGQQ